jgi:hypothetical protein
MDYSKYKKLELRRKFWKFFGAEIKIVDPASETLVGFIRMKAWKLREDVRLYSDESMTNEVMAIHARQIIDFGATYDVTDSAGGGTPLFSLKRKGFRSALVRDTWEILDPAGTVVGMVRETSGNLAIVRRWLGAISDVFDLIFAFVKQTYEITYAPAGQPPVVIAELEHTKNPFVVKLVVDTSMAPDKTDGRITVAAGAMLSVIDATKNN